MPGDDSTRSFGKSPPRGAGNQQPRTRSANSATGRGERADPHDQPDAMRDSLETLAERRQRRDELVDPLRPADDPHANEPTRAALRQIAELRRAQQEPPDLSSGTWERVVDLARPLITRPGTDAPPRSPEPPTNGPRRRTPGR